MVWYLHLQTSLFIFLSSSLFHNFDAAAALTSSPSPTPKQRSSRRKTYDYDLIIIGAGASGMFAAGTSSSFGCRTLLIEKMPLSDDSAHDDISREEASLDKAIASKGLFVGGDCTNAACVPSKAMRSISNIAAITARAGAKSKSQKNIDWFHFARNHSKQTVEQVRNRESVKRLASVPSLDLVFVSNASFVGPHDVALQQPFWCRDEDKNKTMRQQQEQEEITIVSSKKFLITTGANPVQPSSILNAAGSIKLPVLTYRTLFRPDGEGKMSDQHMWNILSSTINETLTEQKSTTTTSSIPKKKNVVIAGGGPVGCEVAQILSRLTRASSSSSLNDNTDISITIVAPTILSSEDVSVRYATREMLNNDGVSIIPNKRVVDVTEKSVEDGKGMKKYVIITDENNKSNTTIPVDVLILAMGREPGTNLENLNLHNAGVEWTNQDGITVHPDLRSVSAKHVYAAGDSASAVHNRDRRAVHAGWTGYHAVQSAFLPRFFKPSSAVHPFVPRVIYTNPEIASIGMSYVDCVREFGPDGFRSMREYELNTDRADTDSLERDTTVGFVELRVSSLHGRILGATVVSPSASELINEVAVALVHGMSCRNIARCLHSYPSHGYLMYRVSLALALSDVWGLLAACGPLGRVASAVGGTASYVLRRRGRKQKWWWRSSQRRHREWEVRGADREFVDLPGAKAMVNYTATSMQKEHEQNMIGLSFIEVSRDVKFSESARTFVEQNETGDQKSIVGNSSLFDFVQWLQEKPI